MSFVIGVTGHRALPGEKVPSIAQSVRDYYTEIQTAHGEIAVLSPCAEGADMLCARIAVEQGLRLTLLLPMDAADYRRDFSADAAAEFDLLLSRAAEVFTVTPLEPVPGSPSRGFFYRQAGLFTVKHCDVLLAIWDGVERDSPDGAGTWETVKLARASGVEIRLITGY